ncbi:cysteine hydrolase family protein [Acetobacter senegalensis]|uniref:cysteine hydrolase family protein n=1 Tax=Acetobacter senegalensis TaxID=446692 RepID=UPI001EDBD2C7|nr:isochorismatase family cysteine hydrolase [Acetobacter senegalensis]MCG4255307.1 cysteine hydrolase [Acetobacter senegalensis]MCG4274579.1 cysteine hydrolase [Acetobacter senegalensis]
MDQGKNLIQPETFLQDERWLHVCIDMQNMFREKTPWRAPWMPHILPNVVDIVKRNTGKTVFTRFIPPQSADDARGAWREYYGHWHEMTRAEIDPHLLELVPELGGFASSDNVFEKNSYSAWRSGEFRHYVRRYDPTAIVLTGGETDICVLFTALEAIDRGYKTVVISDAIYSSMDEMHDTILDFYTTRFTNQLLTLSTREFNCLVSATGG